MRIVITGGHLSPALAVIDTIREKYQNTHSLVFVGRKYTDMQGKDGSLEYQEIQKRGLPFLHLDAGRLTWIISWRTVKQFLLIGKGFIQSWKILSKQQPDIILSFGGFIALPIAYVAWLKGIPVFTHEQTINPGLANKLIARIADTIFVSFPETEKMFPDKKVVLSGNPIRTSIYTNKSHQQKSKCPVVYITGGSLGSHSINNRIEHILERLLEKYIVIHQTGDVAEYADFDRLSKLRGTFAKDVKQKYILKKHINSDEIGSVYAEADIVVGRSGANTFFELIALQKPSVLIPLPWASHGEQEKHAQILKQAGVAEIFYQTDSSKNLLSSIERVLSRKDKMKDAFMQLRDTYIHHAEEVITHTIFETQ